MCPVKRFLGLAFEEKRNGLSLLIDMGMKKKTKLIISVHTVECSIRIALKRMATYVELLHLEIDCSILTFPR